MNTAPYSWLQKVEEGLSVLNDVPLWGHIPPFPWETFSSQLKSLLKLTDLHLKLKENRLLSPSDFLKGMGNQPLILVVEMGAFTDPLFWVMAEEDVAKLASWALCGNSRNEALSNRALQEGFYRYLCLEALNGLSAPFNMTFKMIPAPELPDASALCLDVSIAHNRETLTGRLITSGSFQKSLTAHFATRKYSLVEGSQGLEVPLTLTIGHTVISLEEWKSLQPGDVLFFDSLTYDPKSEKAGVTVTLGTIPLFMARFKHHKLTILDYAFYQEEELAMDSENTHSGEMGEEKEGEHLWSEGSTEDQDVSKIIGSKEIPLNLVVEIGRLRMSVEKLLQLQPGNTIDLGIRPEQGVSLTVNGNLVARAELVQLGDALGLKILEIGQ